ncbi:hypothetical protein TrRE_jg108, partial [Triparma retinervis]
MKEFQRGGGRGDDDGEGEEEDGEEENEVIVEGCGGDYEESSFKWKGLGLILTKQGVDLWIEIGEGGGRKTVAGRGCGKIETANFELKSITGGYKIDGEERRIFEMVESKVTGEQIRVVQVKGEAGWLDVGLLTVTLKEDKGVDEDGLSPYFEDVEEEGGGGIADMTRSTAFGGACMFELTVSGLSFFTRLRSGSGMEFVKARVKEISGQEGRRDGKKNKRKMQLYRRNDIESREEFMVEVEFKKDTGEGGLIKVDLKELCWRYRVNEGVMLRVIGKFGKGGKKSADSTSSSASSSSSPSDSSSDSSYAIFFNLHSPLLHYVSPQSPSVTPATFLLSVNEVKISTVNIGGEGVRWKAAFKGVEGRVGNKRIDKDITMGRLVTPITISSLTLILLRNPDATPPNPRMSFQISQPDNGPSAECVRLYLCRDSFRVMTEMVGQWWWLFGCSRELEEEIREEVNAHPLEVDEGGGDGGIMASVEQDDDVGDLSLDSSWVYDDFPSYATAPTGAIWYNADDGGGLRESKQVKIFPQHVPVAGGRGGIEEGDMGVKDIVGGDEGVEVGTSCVVNGLTVVVRLFEGYDWVEDVEGEVALELRARDRKGGDRLAKYGLVEFFEVTVRNLSMRTDSVTPTESIMKGSRLASAMDINLGDFWCLECITTEEEKKAFLEWRNDVLHPRDEDEGMVMIKVVSFHPEQKFSVDAKLMSNDSRFAMKMQPLRCFIDQRVIFFVKDFFDPLAGYEGMNKVAAEEDKERVKEKEDRGEKVDDLMEARETETYFKSASVNATKMKINYTPVGVDVAALKTGKYSELINLFPLDDLLLDLEPLKLENITGWGTLFSKICSDWISHITATQVHRFVQATPPFNTITNLGSAAQQLVVIPMEEYKKKPNVHGVHRGINKGLKKFGEGVAVEGASTISKVSKFIANKAAEGLGDAKSSVLATDSDDIAEAGKAASRGLRNARHSITMIPDVNERRGGMKAGMLVPIAVVQAGGGVGEA